MPGKRNRTTGCLSRSQKTHFVDISSTKFKIEGTKFKNFILRNRTTVDRKADEIECTEKILNELTRLTKFIIYLQIKLQLARHDLLKIGSFYRTLSIVEINP